MNVYKISCYSECGSYFESYLQSITVIADTDKMALEIAKKWLIDNDESFLRPEKDWNISLMTKNISNNMVIDTHQDSDY